MLPKPKSAWQISAATVSMSPALFPHQGLELQMPLVLTFCGIITSTQQRFPCQQGIKLYIQSCIFSGKTSALLRTGFVTFLVIWCWKLLVEDASLVGEPLHLYLYLLFFIFIFLLFLGLHPWHMEVPRLAVESELQLLACTTDTAKPDLSRVCDLHHSSQQCRIPDPLNEARDRTHILEDTSWIRFCCSTTGTPYIYIYIHIYMESYIHINIYVHIYTHIYLLFIYSTIFIQYLLVGWAQSEVLGLSSEQQRQISCAQGAQLSVEKAEDNPVDIYPYI